MQIRAAGDRANLCNKVAGTHGPQVAFVKRKGRGASIPFEQADYADLLSRFCLSSRRRALVISADDSEQRWIQFSVYLLTRKHRRKKMHRISALFRTI